MPNITYSLATPAFSAHHFDGYCRKRDSMAALTSPPPSSRPGLPRVWQRMLSGRRLDLADPSPFDIEGEDIALGLARQHRWNGQTLGEHGFSVAQHSLFVTEIMRRRHSGIAVQWQLAALLHDAPEFVCHDLITPLKNLVGDVFRNLEDNLQRAIHIRFGLPALLPIEVKRKIKQADKVAAATEAVRLAGFSSEELRPVLGISCKPLPDTLEAWPAERARRLFLSEVERLTLLMPNKGKLPPPHPNQPPIQNQLPLALDLATGEGYLIGVREN